MICARIVMTEVSHMNKINEEMLRDVSGGKNTNSIPKKNAYCPGCKKESTFRLGSGGRAVCEECGEEILL